MKFKKEKIRIYFWLSPILIICLCFSGLIRAQEKIYPGKTWEKIENPEAAGWSVRKLKAALEYAESKGTVSLMIIEQGKVIVKLGDINKSLHVFSIRKSILSALFGIYVHKGKVNLNSSLRELNIDDKDSPLSEQEKDARVTDLLKARSGVYHPAVYETPGMQKKRPKRDSHKPGEFWFYNNWDFNALGTIFEKQAEISIFEAFQKHIAAPLQMEDFDIKNTEYVKGKESIHPAFIFRMSAGDLARFGLLFLYKGKWKNQQIIPESWVNESTKPYSDLGILGGYGYMWWSALNGEHFPFLSMPDGTFSARGTGQQIVLVIPKYKMVIVHQTDVESSTPPYMKVTTFGRILQKIIDAKNN